MNINETNKQAVHDVLIKDLQKRLYDRHKQYVLENATPGELGEYDEDYDTALSVLVNKILHCSSIKDVNDLLLEYIDMFDGEKIYNHIFTLDGTMNYVIGLLVESCKVNVKPV